MEFPIFKTKIEGLNKKFDLNNPRERKEYFRLKAGKEIEKLKSYCQGGNSFIAYLLGKKNSGKGTYAKMFAEIIDPETIEHFSIGDMIRGVDKELEDKKKKKELIEFLETHYRGWVSVEELISALEKRSTKVLLPTELILALIKREIGKKKKKTLFIDGFPRDLDQISYSLFFRDLIGYREDPDVFVLIDVPESVIDARMRSRVVCPLCQTSRNLRLLPTSKIDYDEKTEKFYLVCDNPKCRGARMVRKEGDELGIKAVRERIKLDAELSERAFSLYGIPNLLLRNSVPVSVAKKYVDDYEITPEYIYKWSGKKVEIKEKPWIIKDDQGAPSYSLLAPPVVVAMIKHLAEILHL